MFVLSMPAIFSLELTPACNNACSGCSNVYSAERRPAPTSAGTWAQWLAGFGPEAVQIRLTGGEPSLHAEFGAIVAAAASYDAHVTVFTNARWPAPQAFLAAVRGAPRPVGLLVSLHGAHPASHEAFTRTPGSFAETLANIQRAVAAGVPVALSTIITTQSYRQVPDVLSLARRLGAEHVAFNRYLGSPLPGIEPTARQVRAAVRDIEALIRAGEPVGYGIGMPQCFAPNSSEGCLAGVAYLSIDPWGRVRPCAHSPSLIGSLHGASLGELWHSQPMQVWRSLMPAACTDCAAYAACHGGCRAVQELRANGRDPLRRRPLVEYEPAVTERILPAGARVAADVRLRPEAFGYVALGQGKMVPMRAEARPLIEACDGTATLSELAARFGSAGLELLGDLWENGMLHEV